MLAGAPRLSAVAGSPKKGEGRGAGVTSPDGGALSVLLDAAVVFLLIQVIIESLILSWSLTIADDELCIQFSPAELRQNNSYAWKSAVGSCAGISV